MNSNVGPVTVAEARRALEARTCSAESLLDRCLARVDDPGGEGVRAFLTVHREEARAAALMADEARARGRALGSLNGIPLSIKDLFDEAGHTTTAGSLVLRDSPPAAVDAPVVARLRAAGATIIGRTNMTEFAYSGVGLNPHFGTPRAPFDRVTGRIPGGSTSGGAVSVADGMALAALGSDTGGSVRIPAAFCGVVGFMPTRGRIPTRGSFPLAPSFDSVGLIANSVGDCRYVEAAILGAGPSRVDRSINQLRIGIASGLPFEDLEQQVANAMERVAGLLGSSGATLKDVEGFDWSAPGRLLGSGRVTAVECLACHGPLFERRSEYDPRVATRIEAGATVAAVDYVRAVRQIGELRSVYGDRTSAFDVIVMPTVICVPPPISELADDVGYFRVNGQVLRNTSIANILGLCALSMPVHGPGEAPIGLMMMAAAGNDAALLDVAEAVEQLVRRQ